MPEMTVMNCERLIPKAFRNRGGAGFTLVELMVVMVLVSLFMVFSIPLFSNIGTSSLGTSARRLSGTIKYLFNESALSGLEYRLIYNLDRGTYRAQVLEADGELVAAPDQGREASLKGDVLFKDLQLPGRGKFTAGQVTTRIHPSGWVEETIIHLDDGAGEMLTLRVMPLTGTTEIFDGYREF
ncbi:MAG: prepilin-type N-terminal cleavage/methylation domain-containing protein [Deltaproteobacteria bacterium]|nr:prepilin-type N-terminal cleavage/methylation domain-containing protein [Deltaproteobacteria bacterium]